MANYVKLQDMCAYSVRHRDDGLSSHACNHETGSETKSFPCKDERSFGDKTTVTAIPPMTECGPKKVIVTLDRTNCSDANPLFSAVH